MEHLQIVIFLTYCPAKVKMYLAFCLREQVARQGQKQLRRQQSKPDWPRPLAFWQTWGKWGTVNRFLSRIQTITWQWRQKVPQQQIPQSPQQLQSPWLHTLDIFGNRVFGSEILASTYVPIYGSNIHGLICCQDGLGSCVSN